MGTKKFTKDKAIKIAAVAAGLCIAVIGTVVLVKNIEQKGGRTNANTPQESEANMQQPTSGKNTENITQEVETSVSQPLKVIWANSDDQIWKDYTEQSTKGTIILADELKIMMEKSENAADIFAVRVTDTTGASDEDIFNTFVKPLGIDEEYIETGVIFATAEQIKSFVCPSNLALVLYFAVKPYEDVWINEEYLETAGNEKIKVNVLLKFNGDAVLAKYKDELDALENNDEERLAFRQSVIKKEIAQVMDVFLDDYGISREEVKAGIFTSQFSAELEPKLIAKLLKDGRVEGVLEAVDTPGFDQ